MLQSENINNTKYIHNDFNTSQDFNTWYKGAFAQSKND